MVTRQQALMSQAITAVQGVKDAHPSGDVRKIYGGFCHTFPVLVRSCGLCQAMAFVEAKAADKGERGIAYQTLRKHVYEILRDGHLCGKAQNAVQLSAELTTLPTERYALATRLLLNAWVYYKRFAESILDVKSGEQEQNRA